MKNKIVFALVMMASCAATLSAQEEKNAVKKAEIAWVPGYMRLEGANLYTAGVEGAITATDSVAIVGEFKGATDSSGSIITYRGGVRFRYPSGTRITTFFQGVAGGAKFTDGGPSGFSLAGGAGVDLGLKDWLALRLVQGSYDMFRISSTTLNGFRINSGLVFRIGER